MKRQRVQSIGFFLRFPVWFPVLIVYLALRLISLIGYLCEKAECGIDKHSDAICRWPRRPLKEGS